MYRISQCPELAVRLKAGSTSGQHPARSRACRLHHTTLAGKHLHSVPYSDHVCASCNAGLDLSGAEPPPQHEQWRAQTRQRTGLQRVRSLDVLPCEASLSNTDYVLTVANVADDKRSSVPAKTHATLVRRDNYYATSTSRIRRSSLRESQLEPSNGHGRSDFALLTTVYHADN